VGRKPTERLHVLVPFLNRIRNLDVGKGELLYKQVIRSVMDYARPIWKSAGSCHIRYLRVLQCKFLRIANNAPWYVGKREIQVDLGIPFFVPR
jgi:hypothetical protein